MEWGDEKMSLDLLLYENSELIWHIPGAVQFDVPFLYGLQRSTQDFFFHLCVFFFFSFLALHTLFPSEFNHLYFAARRISRI